MDFLPLDISNFRRQFRQLHFDDIRNDTQSLLETGFSWLGHRSLFLHIKTISKRQVRQGPSEMLSPPMDYNP